MSHGEMPGDEALDEIDSRFDAGKFNEAKKPADNSPAAEDEGDAGY